MYKLIILSLFLSAVSATTTTENSIKENSLVQYIESDDTFDSPMIKFEIDYELEKIRTINFLPDHFRLQLVEKLRLEAVKIKVKVIDLVEKIDNEIVKLENVYNNRYGFEKNKVWAQIHSLKLLRTVTMAGLDKFDKYIVDKNSKVLERLIMALEELLEQKFNKFIKLSKISIEIIKEVGNGLH